MHKTISALFSTVFTYPSNKSASTAANYHIELNLLKHQVHLICKIIFALFFAVSTFLPNKLTSAANTFLNWAIQFKPFFKQHMLEKNNGVNTTPWFTLTVIRNAFNKCSHYWTYISNTCTLINLISFSWISGFGSRCLMHWIKFQNYAM